MTGKFFIENHDNFPEFYNLSTYNKKHQIEEFAGIVPDDFIKTVVTMETYSRLLKGEKIAFRVEEVKDGS